MKVKVKSEVGHHRRGSGSDRQDSSTRAAEKGNSWFPPLPERLVRRIDGLRFTNGGDIDDKRIPPISFRVTDPSRS